VLYEDFSYSNRYLNPLELLHAYIFYKLGYEIPENTKVNKNQNYKLRPDQSK